jgi:PTS system mannose-specific IIA component
MGEKQGSRQMIGLVLVTHGKLALEFVSALEHVVGKQEKLATISISPDDNIENRRDDILAAVDEVDMGNGVIIVTDMFGGTPSNLAISVMERENLEVIAGANLPMLIKIASLRKNTAFDETVAQALYSGRKYINAASELLDGD